MADESGAASSLPATARAVVIGAGIVGNSLAGPPRAPRLEGPGPDRQGPAAQPGRLHRPRVELHLPRRPLARDDGRSPPTACASTRSSACSPSAAASRWRAPRSAWRSCAAGWRRPSPGASSGVLARHARRDQGARAVHRRERDRRRLLLGGRGRRGLAAHGHAHARAGAGDAARAHGVRQHRGARHRRGGRPREARAHRPRRRGGRVRGDRLRRLEPAASRGWPARRSRSRRPCTR